MNADIEIQAGVFCTQRDNSQPFRPTVNWSETFFFDTTLDTYATDLPDIAEQVYAYVLSEKLNGSEVYLHIAVRVDNVTHPPVGAGVVPLAKAHRDCKLTHLELTGEEVILDFLAAVVEDLRRTSKYDAI